MKWPRGYVEGAVVADGSVARVSGAYMVWVDQTTRNLPQAVWLYLNMRKLGYKAGMEDIKTPDGRKVRVYVYSKDLYTRASLLRIKNSGRCGLSTWIYSRAYRLRRHYHRQSRNLQQEQTTARSR